MKQFVLIVLAILTVSKPTYAANMPLTNESGKIEFVTVSIVDGWNPYDYTGEVTFDDTLQLHPEITILCGNTILPIRTTITVAHIDFRECILYAGKIEKVDALTIHTPGKNGYAMYSLTPTTACSANVADLVLPPVSPGTTSTAALPVTGLVNGDVRLRSNDMDASGMLDLGGKGQISVVPGEGVTSSQNEWKVTGESPQIKVTASSAASGTYTSNLTATVTCA